MGVVGMNKQQALKQLEETKVLETGLLKPLGIEFESFLRYAQLDPKAQELIIDQLITALRIGQNKRVECIEFNGDRRVCTSDYGCCDAAHEWADNNPTRTLNDYCRGCR